MTIATEAELENAILESPLGANWVEGLPAMRQMLRELVDELEERKERKRRRRKLNEQRLIATWAEYRQKLKELRERLLDRNRRQWDDLLAWLMVFMMENYQKLAHVSAIDNDDFSNCLRGVEPESALVLRKDWQDWAVDWLHDELLEGPTPDSTPVPPAPSGDGGSGDDGDLGIELSPKKSDGDDLEY